MGNCSKVGVVAKEENRHIRMTDLGESERPREKLLTHGPKALSNRELMAIQLGSGLQGMNALDLAHTLLQSAEGNLYRLYENLKNGTMAPIKGIGEAKKANILACLELGMRMIQDKEELANRGKQLTNSQMIYRYIYQDMYDLKHEELWVVLFDSQLVPKRKLMVSRGGLNASTADIRVILGTALRLELTALALIHNHPGGSLEPSRDDDLVTRNLWNACKCVDLTLLDHLIFTDHGYYSYMDNARFGEFYRASHL